MAWGDNTEVAWVASVTKPASGACSEHVWCVPEKTPLVEKSVIAFINKLTRFFYYVQYMAHHAFKG